MTTTPRHRQSWFFSAIAGFVLLGTGCCGPMACGPGGTMGGGGVVSFGGSPACGDGCNGCGERYIDEWVNHPPSCNDPCDSCGNFNGQSCHSCRPIFSGFPSLWGYRCDPPPRGCDRVNGLPSCDGGCDSGCSTCGVESGFGSGHPIPLESDGHPILLESESVEFQGPVRLHPHELDSRSPKLVKPVPNARSYQPQRSRQIFHPRDPSVAGRQRANGY